MRLLLIIFIALQTIGCEKKNDNDEFPELEPPLDPEIVVEKAEVKNEIKKPSKTKKVAAIKPFKKVKIITKNVPLRVRANPSGKAPVVAQLPTKAIVLMFKEIEQWYQIEYLPGKKGWISKKYSKLVN